MKNVQADPERAKQIEADAKFALEYARRCGGATCSVARRKNQNEGQIGVGRGDSDGVKNQDDDGAGTGSSGSSSDKKRHNKASPNQAAKRRLVSVSMSRGNPGLGVGDSSSMKPNTTRQWLMQHVHQLQAIGSDWSTEACIGALLLNKSSVNKPSADASAQAWVQYDLNAAVETLFNVSAIPDGLHTLATQGEKLSTMFVSKAAEDTNTIMDRPPPEL